MFNEVTTATFRPFVDGQLEVKCPLKRLLLRGDISSLNVEADTLWVRLSWMAECRGYPGASRHWVITAQNVFTLSLLLYGVTLDDRSWLQLRSPVMPEVVSIMPPGSEGRLALAQIESRKSHS